MKAWYITVGGMAVAVVMADTKKEAITRMAKQFGYGMDSIQAEQLIEGEVVNLIS